MITCSECGSRVHLTGPCKVCAKRRKALPVKVGVDALLPCEIQGDVLGSYYLADALGSALAESLTRTQAEYLRDAVNSCSAWVRAAKATLEYVDNLNEDTPVDMNCKECVGVVYFDRGTTEPPLCWIHQLKAIIKEQS